MILLHKKKIIIFHNRKTSGTSFSLLMSLIASKGDYFPFYTGQLIVKKKILKKFKFHKYQRFSDIKFLITFKNLTYNFLLFFAKKIDKKKYKKINYRFPYIIYKDRYYSHTTPEDFKKNINLKIYKNYHKFSVYRNFSDQIYSMYNHFMQYQKFITYEEWVNKNLENFYKSSLKFYKKDFLYFNFHKMEQSLRIFCIKFNIKKNLPKYYGDIKLRSNYTKYPKILSKKTKKKIRNKEKIIYELVKNKLLSK
jgi:hypothetical protein